MPAKLRYAGAMLLPPLRPGAAAYAWAALAVAAATAVARLCFGYPDLADIVMVYLLAIALTAARLGRGPSLLASILSVAALDWFFIPPTRTFAVSDFRHLGTFAVMLLVGLLISGLTERAGEAHRIASEERMRSALLSSVSHDLRTPLSGILGAATALIDDPGTSADAKVLAQTIQDESQRLHRIVTNLLDITRVESGSLKVAKEWVPLEELVGSALARLEGASQGREIRVDLPEELPMAQVDPVLFEQALVNLLENALRHGGDPIEVDARVAGSSLILSIRDRGPGLPEGHESRIFDKLVRGPEAKGAGAGLGLAICKGIAEAHGGAIRAANRPGGGAEFHVTLPLGQAPPPPPDEDNSSES